MNNEKKSKDKKREEIESEIQRDKKLIQGKEFNNIWRFVLIYIATKYRIAIFVGYKMLTYIGETKNMLKLNHLQYIFAGKNATNRQTEWRTFMYKQTHKSKTVYVYLLSFTMGIL